MENLNGAEHVAEESDRNNYIHMPISSFYTPDNTRRGRAGVL